jgi:hypothetical protein
VTHKFDAPNVAGQTDKVLAQVACSAIALATSCFTPMAGYLSPMTDLDRCECWLACAV